MNKTAIMQMRDDLHERLAQAQTRYINATTDLSREKAHSETFLIRRVLSKIEKMLPVERQQIIDAYIHDADPDSLQDAERYYNQTYLKTEEHG